MAQYVFKEKRSKKVLGKNLKRKILKPNVGAAKKWLGTRFRSSYQSLFNYGRLAGKKIIMPARVKEFSAINGSRTSEGVVITGEFTPGKRFTITTYAGKKFIYKVEEDGSATLQEAK